MDCAFGEVTFYLAAVVLALLAVVLYRQFTLLRRHGIPGPTPWPMLGNLPEQFRKGFGEAQETWHVKYGTVYGFYNGYRPAVAVRDPELVKMILVKDFPNFTDRPAARSIPRLMRDGLFFMEGRKWKKTRNILTPTFSATKLRIFVPVLNKCAETLAKHIGDHTQEVVDIKKFFSHFTMDAIASTAFGIDVDSQNNPNDPFVSNIDPVFNFGLSRKLIMICSMAIPKFADIMALLGLHSWPTKSIDFYAKIGQMLIKERRQDRKSRTDFIKMLLEAEFDEKKEYIHNGSDLGHASNGVAQEVIERLTDDEIIAQAFLFFIAGYETTASTLRFAAYTLACHPDIDQKLYDEINNELADEEPTYDNLTKLKYMDMFLDEVLRCYPPVDRLVRTVKDEITYGDLKIPKGISVIIPVYGMQHDPKYYPNPDTFDPDRFSADAKNATPTNGVTYLPFGVGPRHCIGMRLAQVEIKIALVHVLRRVRFARCDKTEVPLKLNRMNVVQPVNPVQVRLEER